MLPTGPCRKCGGTDFRYYPQRGVRQCRPCALAATRRWAANPVTRKRYLDRMRRWHLFDNYGITPEQKEAQLKKQKGRCGVCKVRFKTGREAHVDHCHTTGKTRGLLCGRCNKGLGFFRDDPICLRAAIEYLKRHGGN